MVDWKAVATHLPVHAGLSEEDKKVVLFILYISCLLIIIQIRSCHHILFSHPSPPNYRELVRLKNEMI